MPHAITIQWIGLVASAFAGGVFVVSFRRVLSQVRMEATASGDGPLAEARVRGTGLPASVVSGRQWLARMAEDALCTAQAAFIAVGITAVVVMVMGMVGALVMLSLAA